MAVWSDSYPTDIDANTLHTVISGHKPLIMDRLRASNGTFEEHDVYGSGATGEHDNRTGFAKVHSTYAAFESAHASSPYADGTVHVVKSPVGIYLIYDGDIKELSVSEHGELEGLLNDDHTQYVLRDGTRSMSGDITMSGVGVYQTAASSANSDALEDDHTFLLWHEAHGDDCLIDRHFADDSILTSDLNVSTKWSSTSGFDRYMNVRVYGPSAEFEGLFFPNSRQSISLTNAIYLYSDADRYLSRFLLPDGWFGELYSKGINLNGDP